MKTFIISDTHFGHQGMCEFTNDDGSKVRPWLLSQDADRHMIEKWNATVGKEDKVYHLGDVAFHSRHLEIMAMLNGRKVLIKGNHDRLKLSQYIKYFKDIRGVHILDRIILSHIPIHPASKARFKGNIHGHTHSNFVLDENGKRDKWYFNVSVEAIDYTPINFNVIQKYFSTL